MPEAIKIPFIIPSRNEVDEMHWTEKMRLRKQYELFIRAEMTKRKIKKAKPGECFKLKIHTMRKRLIRDYSNRIGGVKQMEDALLKIAYTKTWPRGAAQQCKELARETLDIIESARGPSCDSGGKDDHDV